MRDQIVDNDINKLPSTSPNFRIDLAKKLEELVPEAIADGKVDVVKLKELLAEDAGEPNERFGLFWPGKKQALRAAQEPTTATLRPAKDESKDWDTTNNIFIEGDNLEVLKVLQKQYHNSIKMIYIDPPYNTGKDFVYPDNFKEGLQNYLEFSKQVDEGNKKISTNTETVGRYHSNWLNIMYPRLKLARNLLTDDGVIFISIDDAEQANLKKICDEIFGEGNFITQITWYKSYGKNESKYFSNNIEYILVYQRGGLSHEYLKPKEGLEDVKRLLNSAREKSENLSIVQSELRAFYKSNPHLKGISAYNSVDESYDAWRAVSMEKPKDPQYFYDIIHPTTGKPCKIPKKGWRMPKETADRYLSENRIIFGQDENTIPNRKYYLSDVEMERVKNFINNSDQGGKNIQELFPEGSPFDYPKAVSVIKYILEISNLLDGDIILDFFAGSATTAHAVMQLNAEDGGNRKHIMVQLPEPTDEKSEAFKAGYKKISDIARERINRAGEKIKVDFADKLAERETPLDVGYRTYKLADTNFTKWQSAPTGDLTELQARLDLMRESSNDNASEEDLLVEVLLKMGLPLTTRTQTVDVDGLHVYQVVAEGDSTEGQPVLYLNEHTKPTLDQLRAIITDLTPSKFVILDDAFQGDNQLKTNLVQTCKSYDVELWTV